MLNQYDTISFPIWAKQGKNQSERRDTTSFNPLKPSFISKNVKNDL